MFCTAERVNEITGYDADVALIRRAQSIIETVIGRMEVDISDARDLDILEKATAYQSAYMKNNFDRTFEQPALSQIVQNSSVITFKAGSSTSPWLAPLADLALKNLSWRRSRSVRTGKTLGPRARRCS